MKMSATAFGSKARIRVAAISALVAALAAGLWFGTTHGSAASVDSGDQMQITGFTSANLADAASGPVTVYVHGEPAARIAALVGHLSTASTSGCMENTVLYRVVSTAPADQHQDFNAVGYACDGAVRVTSGGTSATRRDSNCALLLAVRRALPSSARATQTETAGCAE
jgi:hypothetical protein